MCHDHGPLTPASSRTTTPLGDRRDLLASQELTSVFLKFRRVELDRERLDARHLEGGNDRARRPVVVAAAGRHGQHDDASGDDSTFR